MGPRDLLDRGRRILGGAAVGHDVVSEGEEAQLGVRGLVQGPGSDASSVLIRGKLLAARRIPGTDLKRRANEIRINPLDCVLSRSRKEELLSQSELKSSPKRFSVIKINSSTCGCIKG